MMPKDVLGNLIIHQKGFAFKSRDYIDSGIPVVRVSNFTADSISIEDIKYIDHSIAEINHKVRLNTGDIVIATVGSWPSNPTSIVGKTIQVPPELDGSLMNQNSVILRAKSSKAAFAQSLIKKLEKTEIIEVENNNEGSIKINFPLSVNPGKQVLEIIDLKKNAKGSVDAFVLSKDIIPVLNAILKMEIDGNVTLQADEKMLRFTFKTDVADYSINVPCCTNKAKRIDDYFEEYGE